MNEKEAIIELIRRVGELELKFIDMRARLWELEASQLGEKRR